MSPERRRSAHVKNGFEGPAAASQQQQLKSGFRMNAARYQFYESPFRPKTF
jgi:hypothetical protein